MDDGALAALLRRHARTHGVPGAATGVLRKRAITSACYGLADVRTGDPVTLDTRFSLGSLTKPMVATVVVGLAGAGRLSLADPVATHVPELRGIGWAERASLRDLLANRSGLPLRAETEFGFSKRTGTDDDALSRLAADIAANLAADASGPGVWSYTNAGWCLLGRAIETVTGTAWEDAMASHLGGPHLHETTFNVATVTPGRASGHEVTRDGAVPVEPLASRAYGPAGANAVSTVADLLRFAAHHLEDPSLSALRATHADVSIRGWLDSWCLGWARFDWTGGPVWGWDGLISGERSMLRIMPAQEAAVAVMTNGSSGRAMCRSLLAELMPTLFGIGVPALGLGRSPEAATDLSRYAGVYGWPDRQVEVTTVENHLLITDDEYTSEAYPLDKRTFAIDATDPDNPTVTFAAFDAHGCPQVLYLMLWGLPRRDA